MTRPAAAAAPWRPFVRVACTACFVRRFCVLRSCVSIGTCLSSVTVAALRVQRIAQKHPPTVQLRVLRADCAGLLGIQCGCGCMTRAGSQRGAPRRVRWYVFVEGAEVDLHNAHWHGNVLMRDGHKVDQCAPAPALCP